MPYSNEMPDFVREAGGADAVAEFKKFALALPESAMHLLSKLAMLHNHGAPYNILYADDYENDKAATDVRGLCCRLIKDWAVFYAVSRHWEVTVVHVGHINPHSFSSLESEAANRLRRRLR